MSTPNDAPQDTPAQAAPGARAVDAEAPKSNAPAQQDPADKPGYVNALPENVVVSPDKDADA